MWLHQICIHAWQNICMFTHVELVDTPAPPFLLGGMTAAFAFLSSLSSSKKGAKDSESESSLIHQGPWQGRQLFPRTSARRARNQTRGRVPRRGAGVLDPSVRPVCALEFADGGLDAAAPTQDRDRAAAVPHRFWTMAAQLGGPVLLKQGYMQIKTTFGWKRQYYRLLQDSLFSFKTHESKTPTDELSLMGGFVKDASWQMKRANCLEVESDSHRKVYFICENSLQHQQWFDALYYGTTVSTLAEYCSPLSGGWLYFFENNRWSRRWFMIRDSFLLCYNSREDVTPVTTDGKPVNRRFVLPLVGVVVAYHKTTKNYSFSLQIMSMGELKHEFIFAAESEAIMNVWMEVLYVSTGRDLPDFANEDNENAFDLATNLEDLRADATPEPSKSHHAFTKGKGLDPERLQREHAPKRAAAEQFVDLNDFEPVDHANATKIADDLPVSSQREFLGHEDSFVPSFVGRTASQGRERSSGPKADTGFSMPDLASFGFGFDGGDTRKQGSGSAEQTLVDV